MVIKLKNLIRKRGVIIALLIVVSVGAASAQLRERTVVSWRPLHYNLDLSFDEQMSELAAARSEVTVEVMAPSIDSVDLDFGELMIDSVQVSGKAARFERTAETLN